MFIPYSLGSSSWSVKRATKEAKKTMFWLSTSFLVIQALVILKFFYMGFALDELSSISDLIALPFIVISFLYSIFCPLALSGGYYWGLGVKFTSIVATMLGIISSIYALNISSYDNIKEFSKEDVTATVVSKGTWSKVGSFVLSSEDDVLTYDYVINFHNVRVGDKITSVSEAELVRTYTDLFGLSTQRKVKGVVLERKSSE